MEAPDVVKSVTSRNVVTQHRTTADRVLSSRG